MLLIPAQDENENPVMVEVSDRIIFWLYFITTVELIINLIGLLTICLCILILYKRPLFHFNLISMLSCGFVACILITLCGISSSIACYLDFSILANPSIYPETNIMILIEGVRMWSVFTAIFIFLSIVSERVWATIKIKYYEHTNNPWTVGIILFFCWANGLGCFILSFCLRYYKTTILILSLMLLYNAIAFYLTYKTNEKRLKTLKSQVATDYILSKRFQLSENIRVFKMLERCNMGFFVCVLVGICFVLIMLFGIKYEFLKVREYVIREGLHIIVSVACNSICLCAITGTYVWRELLKIYLKRMFLLKFTSNQVNQSEEEIEDPTKKQDILRSQVKNTDGEQLAFKDETGIYFKQLQDMWN